MPRIAGTPAPAAAPKPAAAAPAAKPAATGSAGKPLATVAGINRPAGDKWSAGPVFATIAGKKQKLADEGLNAWVLGGGRFVAWSGRDGAGGFENEGQSLHVFDTQTGKSSKVMAEHFMVDKVNSVQGKDGKWAFIVAGSDGGLGGDHLAVVSPEKGQVYAAPGLARALDMTGGKLKVGFYSEENYGDSGFDGGKGKPPKKTVTLDITQLLKQPGYINKHDMEEFIGK